MLWKMKVFLYSQPIAVLDNFSSFGRVCTHHFLRYQVFTLRHHMKENDAQLFALCVAPK
jgi:hypothetical protein